jgi:hypothetical protein
LHFFVGFDVVCGFADSAVSGWYIGFNDYESADADWVF